MSNTVITFPTPPYSNTPIQPNFYQPKVFVISNLLFGQTTTVTTSTDHDYVIGQLVRLLIPNSYGSIQLNEKTGFVISIPTTNQVVVSIDSTGTTPFIPSPTFVAFQSKTPPQIVAVGDVNTGITNTGRTNQITYIPGSFINISP